MFEIALDYAWGAHEMCRIECRPLECHSGTQGPVELSFRIMRVDGRKQQVPGKKK